MTVCLLTGATGTFGQAFLEQTDWTVRAYSRDEHKQSELRDRFPDVRWILGDVRDRARLVRALHEVDVVVHAAALKHVTSCEHNPGEALLTNAVGSWNVVEACLDTGVQKAVLLSSDKAVHPVNVYGATKLAAEKVWLGANAYAGGRCKFAVVRYGNVMGSRGSVFAKTAPRLTDARATRFWMEPAQAVQLVLLALGKTQGGEIFIPKLQSSTVAGMAAWEGEPTGLRPGEKLHEQLVSDEEVGRTIDFGDHYRIVPPGYVAICEKGDFPPVAVPAGFRYTSEAA